MISQQRATGAAGEQGGKGRKRRNRGPDRADAGMRQGPSGGMSAAAQEPRGGAGGERQSLTITAVNMIRAADACLELQCARHCSKLWYLRV